MAVTTSEPPRAATGTPGIPGAAAPLPSSGAPLTTSPGGAAVGTAPAAPSRIRRHARTTGRGLFLALLIFVTVVLVLFVVFNTQTVVVHLVFGEVHVPLVLALVIAAALGGLIIGFAAMLIGARRRSNNNS